MANPSHAPETPNRPAARPARSTLRRVLSFGLWGVSTLFALLVASLLALWFWAGTAGSLPQTVAWAQDWLQGRSEPLGQLRTEGVEGSLRGGGRIASLQWSQDGISVQADGVQLDWSSALWIDAALGRGAHPNAIAIERLRVTDTRAPTPTEPMEALALPLPISLAFRIDHFELAGTTELNLSHMEGRYRYGALGGFTLSPLLPNTAGISDVHQLSLDSLQFADGRYQGQLALGAQAPMPLALALQGKLDTQVPDGAAVQATAEATASGTLSGPLAALDIDATVIGQPATPDAHASRLELQGRIMPWAAQPVHHLNAQAQALNLAALWPSAPKSELSGKLTAEPEGNRWRAQLQLDNHLTGPADQQGLPLQHLQATIVQEGDLWTVSELQATLSGGGEVNGEGRLRLDTSSEQPALRDWQGELQAKSVRPALLWSTLAPGALDASLSAREASGERQPAAVNLQASVKPSAQQPKDTALAGLRMKQLRLQGQWQPANAATAPGSVAPPASAGVLDLKEAHIDLADAQLNSQGRFDTQTMRFDGRLDLKFPGAQFNWSGLIAHAEGKGNAQLQVDDAARVLAWVRGLQTLPLAGPSIKAALSSQQDLLVSGQASAQLDWKGGLGALGFPAPEGVKPSSVWPTLKVKVEVPRLKVQPGDGEDIQLDGIDVRADGPPSGVKLSAQGNASAAGWRVALDSAGQWSAGPVVLEEGQLALSRLALRLTPPKSPPPAKNTAVPPTPTQGFALQNKQPLELAWSSKAGQGMELDAGAGELQLTPLNVGPSAPPEPLTIAWQRMVWQAQALETQGRLQGLSLPWIASLAALGQPTEDGPLAGSGISGDLVLDGAWNVRVPADIQTPLELFATVQRRSGDLQWQTDNAGATGSTQPANAPVLAGVKDAHISLNVKDRQAQALLRWDSERLGQANADLSTTLNPAVADTEASIIDRWWPASTPVQGKARLRLPEVGVWSMITPPGWRMRGTLQADATLAGTRGHPDWRGNVQGDQLALRSVVDGFAFTNGQLRATIDGQQIQVDRFDLEGPGGAKSGGTLKATGHAEWRAEPGTAVRQPFIELKALAERLRVSNRADRRLTLSGEVSAQLEGPKLQLRGQLKADSALFILPDELAPRLGKDVVVRSEKTVPGEKESGQPVQPDVQVSLDLGPQFEVSGQGLKTRLEGQLTMLATPTLPTPRALGEVRTVSGTYRAYGQQLNIETGVLRFTGPYDDPALDILAVRKLPENTDQRVGVHITGNAQAPRVALFAEPDMPDADKIAWLVLGRPASAAGAQAFVLQQAARKLLAGGGEPVDGALAKSLGLDEIGIASPSSNTNGTTSEAALTLGKRLSSKLYLSYEQSLASAMSTVSIFYDLSKRLTLRARAGTENAIDLIFTHRYE